MNSIDYSSNSRKSKEKNKENETDKKKVEKIIKGKATVKKKNGFLNLFVSEDVADVKSYIVFDVLVPAVKKAVSDIVTNGIDMMLYGEAGRHKRGTSSKISYRSYYDRDDRDRERYRERRNMFDYDEIVLENRSEAEDVITALEDIIDQFGEAKVSDLYDLVGMTAPYTANRYGWTSVRTASAIRVRDGYVLKMPRAVVL